MNSTTEENVVRSNPICYFIFYVEHSRLQKVSKHTFRKVAGKVWKPKPHQLVRIKYQSDSSTRINMTQLTQNLRRWLPESFAGDMWTFVNLVPKLIQISKIANDILTPQNVARVSSIFVRIVRVISAEEVDLALLTTLILDIYSLSSFIPESLDSLVMGVAVEFMPKYVKDFLKSVAMISRVKVMEEYPLWQWLCSLITSGIEFLLNTLPIPQVLRDIFTRLRRVLPFGAQYVLLAEASNLLERYTKNKQLIGEQAFQSTVLALNKKIAECEELQDMRKYSVSADQKLNAWKLLVNNVISYQNTSRVEPAMFVFDGPPGTLKSVVMTKVLSNLGLTVYSHLIKATQDGKDFYDSYDNQEVFYMDDVGQQGRSQWRAFINMISSVRMPLECANVALKDTKFFTSDTVMLTTNNFMHLHGFTEQDCISSPEALFRRGLVFDFSQVQRVGGLLSGNVSFKTYSQKGKKFETKGPDGYCWPKNLPLEVAVTPDSTSLLRLVAWIKSVVLNIRKWKMQNFVSLNSSEEERTLLAKLEREFLGEGLQVSTLSSQSGGYHVLNSVGLNGNAEEFDLSYVDAICLSQDDEHGTITRAIYRRGDWDKYLRSTWYETVFAHLKEIATILWDTITSVKTSLFSFCKKEPELMGSIMAYGVIVVFTYLVEAWFKRIKARSMQNTFSSESLAETLSFIQEHKAKTSSQISKVETQMFQVTIHSCDGINVWGLCSGRHVILPSHAIGKATRPVITIWKSLEKGHALLDHYTTNIVLNCAQEDVACLSLGTHFPSPFKHCAIPASVESVRYLTTGIGSVEMDKIRVADTYDAIHYTLKDQVGTDVFTNKIHKANRIVYNLHAKGLCGAVLTDSTTGPCGMHVAGNSNTHAGVAIIWSSNTRTTLQSILAQGCESDLEMSSRAYEQFSGIRLANQVGASVASKSALIPSPLYGIYEVDRSPANLRLHGPCTVKDIAKKSMKLVSNLPADELKFAEDVLRSMMAPFGRLTEKEIVLGNENLAGLNKDSSNGYKMMAQKEYYVDFPNGKLTPSCKEQLALLRESILTGNPDYEKLYWVESLKDEIRNKEKLGVPRSFRVGTILQQILTKEIFGKWTENIMATRGFNKIMVGVNPVKEWPLIHSALISGKVFAGDISNWDGNMAPQIQDLITRVIPEYIENPEDQKIGSCLLQMMNTSLVVVQDDLFITNHSMPSGSFLTAILNSVVNKLYTAMWYKRNADNPTLRGFWEDVDDFVYGDDKLNVVRKDFDKLNAETMRDFFSSVGMGFTDANKKQVDKPFQSINEVSFLKRSFVYHNVLNQIVPALDLRTLRNTLSWVDKTKDVGTVMKDKVAAVQRELYLHPDRVYLLQDFKERLRSREFDFVEFPESYFEALYKLEENNYLIKNY